MWAKCKEFIANTRKTIGFLGQIYFWTPATVDGLNIGTVGHLSYQA